MGENGRTLWKNSQGDRFATVSLIKDLDTGQLAVNAEIPSLDEALGMLEAAHRTLEDQRRIAVMQQAMSKPMPAVGKDILHFGKH